MKDWDENEWVTEIYENITKIMEKAVGPLTEYLDQFKQYEEILSMNVDTIVSEYDK